MNFGAITLISALSLSSLPKPCAASDQPTEVAPAPYKTNEFSIPAGLDSALIGERLNDVRLGAARAELYFGFEVGSHLRDIIVHSMPRTGACQYLSPDKISFHLKMLSSEIDLAPHGFHEVTHLFDDRFKLSAGRFKEWFDTLRSNHPDFLISLSEQNFLPNTYFLGHAQDDHLDFFSSLVSSTNHPELKRLLNEKDQLFRQMYFESIEQLLACIQNCNQIPKHAPITLRLLEILSWQNMSK